jgi:hypothetical protein
MMSEELIDKWPHSVPFIPAENILNAPEPPKKPRNRAEEGGRIAIAGENGWAFFDYHLAMFGPSSVPRGAYRLQMADPPHGCDPSQYQVLHIC